MNTEIIKIDSQNPEPEKIAQAAEILRRGGLVAFPTETVYGLGANALDAKAVQKIFAAKDRPAKNPLIVHVKDEAEAKKLTLDWPETATLLAQQFWPGPLTLVLPRQPIIPDIITGGGPTVALRLPEHKVALALIRSAGFPLAAPSANRSSRLSPTKAEHVDRSLGGRIDLIVDAGATPGGLESTVLDLTATPPRLLRPGLVSISQLEKIIGPVQENPKTESLSADSPPPASPGLMGKHYAPRTSLECCAGDGFWRVKELEDQGLRVGWVTFEGLGFPSRGSVVTRWMPADPQQYAAQIYAVLHQLDDVGVDRMVVSLPPDYEVWQAVRDRLLRAAEKFYPL